MTWNMREYISLTVFMRVGVGIISNGQPRHSELSVHGPVSDTHGDPPLGTWSASMASRAI